MSDETELVDAVLKSAKEINGKKTLTCAQAFGLAERFGVGKRKVGGICNANNVRISNCQLGCFK